jgi:O-antigen/teichoic acid export membrane protein
VTDPAENLGSMAPPVDSLGARPVHVQRIKRWFKALTAFFTAQALTQALGLGAGIILVRSMPVREFALYTLALSVVTFFTLVSDMGSTASLLYFFHRAGRENEPFEPYLAAVRSLRRIAFSVGGLCVAVALPRSALSQGFRALDVGLITLGVLASVWLQIGASLSILTLRLQDNYGTSYRAEIAGGAVRLVSACLLVVTKTLYSWLGIFVNAVAIGTVGLLSRTNDPGLAKIVVGEHRRKVLRYLLPTLPSALYFSIQGPLIVWLSASFGQARNIAEVGALSRLGLFIGLFSNLSSVVFLPRLARIKDDRQYFLRFLQFGAALVAIAVALQLAVTAYPRLLLKVLGDHYAGLDNELILVVLGSCLTLVGAYLVAINLARSWTRWQGPAMIVLAITQAVLVKLLPLGTTRGVLIFNLLSSAMGMLLQAIIVTAGFLRPSWVHWE